MLLVIAWMVILGFPGLDRLHPRDYEGAKREKLLQQGIGGQLEVLVGDIDRLVRRPLADRLEWTQRVPRVSHSWHLYRDGPSKVRRLEVWVDDELWFRSQDKEHDWRRAQLTMRKFRPMVSTTASDPKAKNWRGAVRWIAREAHKDKPELTEVRVVGTAAPFPDGEPSTVKRTYIARPPAFEPMRTQNDKGPSDGGEE
ncbi:MAG: hypothetical protein EP330_31360 [Deltaproteobacteria bacterium]|nr:MAG: hypothetical protein EP330_31360 [Deltaproteobacteria bacterium]